MNKGYCKRVPLVTRSEDLASDKRKFFDDVASLYEGQAIGGPFRILLHSPDLASRIAHTAFYVRFETSLPKDVYELVVLTATRELDCKYAWKVHEVTAAKEGVRKEAVEAIRDGKAPQGLNEDEALVFKYVQELLRTHRVSESTFQKALKKFGLQRLVDLTATIGHYGTLACILNAFEVEPNR